MKTTILDATGRGAASTRFALLLPALLALPLGVAAGCATDDPPTSTATQGLSAGCRIWRPFAWDGVGATCAEARFPPFSYILAEGDSDMFFSSPGPGLGQGEVTIHCDGGVLALDPWDDICIPDGSRGRGRRRRDAVIAARQAYANRLDGRDRHDGCRAAQRS